MMRSTQFYTRVKNLKQNITMTTQNTFNSDTHIVTI